MLFQNPFAKTLQESVQMLMTCLWVMLTSGSMLIRNRLGPEMDPREFTRVSCRRGNEAPEQWQRSGLYYSYPCSHRIKIYREILRIQNDGNKIHYMKKVYQSAKRAQ